MIGHFNTDDLSSYRAGTVSESRAARISAHLSTCPQCADVHSGLGDVSQLLASIQAPPMPETLTQRVHAAIRHEAAQRTATPGLNAELAAAGGRPPVHVPGRPDLPERARRPARRPRIAAWSSPLLVRGLAAAGVLVLLVGGGIVLANQRGVGTSSGASGAAAPEAHAAKPRFTNSAPVGSAAVMRLPYRRGAQTANANVLTSDVNYTRARLLADVRREAAHVAQISQIPSAAMPAASPQPQPQHAVSYTTVGQLESCLSAVATGRLVLFAEIARYLGRPATIIVFTPVNRAFFDVIVVGAACGATRQDIITSLAVPTK